MFKDIIDVDLGNVTFNAKSVHYGLLINEVEGQKFFLLGCDDDLNLGGIFDNITIDDDNLKIGDVNGNFAMYCVNEILNATGDDDKNTSEAVEYYRECLEFGLNHYKDKILEIINSNK